MKSFSEKPKREHKKLLTDAHKNIIQLKAESNYTTFVLLTGKQKTMAYTMGLYKAVLPQSFILVNRSCIINTNFIKNVNYCDQTLTLSDNSEIQIARRRWNDVKRNINNQII